MDLRLNSLKDLSELATLFSQVVPDGVVLLFGNMGAGKTAFVRELEVAYKGDDQVSSPTFSLINRYDWNGIPVRHLDLYRLENPREIDLLDIDNVFLMAEKGGLVLLEWAERLAEDQFPESYFQFEFKNCGSYREVSLSHRGHNERFKALSKLLSTFPSGLISDSKTL